MRPMIEVLVRGIRIEAEGIRSFELTPLDGTLPAWRAGAHLLVEPAPWLQRAYSLCNHPEDSGCYRIAVKHEPASRGGSAAMHALVPGAQLRVSPPANLFEPDPAASQHVLLAGGIGITPLYAMRNALLASHTPVSLHCFARSAAHAAFRDRLGAESEMHYGLDAAQTRSRLGQIVGPHAADAGCSFCLCGPEAFMDAASAVLTTMGVAPERIRSERFGTAGTTAPATNPSGSFRVRFARSGIEAEVPPGKPILIVAREHGVDIPSSCEMGVCGACQTKVLAGEPEHHDQYLSAAEQAAGDCLLPCVSRGKRGTLVIDC